MSIIPRPQTFDTRPTSFTLNSGTAIVCDAATLQTGAQLAAWLRPVTGLALPLQSEPAALAITLRIDAGRTDLGEEGYELNADASGVTLLAAAEAGLFYAAQSLRQLLPVEVFAPKAVANVTWTVPGAHIADRPRFKWRGMHLDVARHFMPLTTVLTYIELLALHKCNRLHLHLTDDQGWRIEIKRYPKLTEVGAWRTETRKGHEYGPDASFDGQPHGGFYTQDDIRLIVAYAAKHHIVVIPEIELPGHAQAALAAYPELGNTGEQLGVFTQWGINKHVFNVNDNTIDFFHTVLEEVMGLFPSQLIHIGGDECPKDEWKVSQDAQARIEEYELKDEDELQSWVIRQMDSFLTQHGRTLVGWDEIIEGGLAENAVVMSWRSEEGGVIAAKAGHDVVMAPTSYTYFDYYQSEAKETEPLTIGGYLPLSKVYSYEPIPVGLTDKEAEHILGAQCQLWTEYIATPERLDYMTFPRLCALAEVVWSARAGRSYDEFLTRLQPHLARLKLLGVNYRPLERG